VRRRSTVLPGTEGGVANLIGGATQAGFGTGIEIGVPNPTARGTGAIAEVVEIGVSNRLPRPAAPIRVKERGVANVGAGTGLCKY
jgi:hypothetical protein